MEAAEALKGRSRVLRSAELSQLATQSGFDLCGFAQAEPIPPHILVSWLEAGYAADMDWMSDRLAERLDVTRLLPGAQTVVALACNYYQPDPPGGSPVARYARGRDYHYTLKDRLKVFRKLLSENHPEVRTFACVDTGPLMEKVWAARAGLGYVGRNGCLITEKFGSYVLLATMVVDAPVDVYSPPSIDRCGECRLCVSACPTEAIVGDKVVDARRCLSYQTIENRRGVVPVNLRSSTADLVFGCDICQDVCPLNAQPVNATERFLPREVGSKSARALAAMTLEEYQVWTPGTPLVRAKYDGLRRNAAYALGAAKDTQARPILEQLARNGPSSVSDAASWALEQLGGE